MDHKGIKDDFRYEGSKSSGSKNSVQSWGRGTSVDRYGKKKTNKKSQNQVLSVDKKNKKRK